MYFKTIVAGSVDVNCYVYADEKTSQAIVIDPGGAFETIKNEITKNCFDLKYIILTHCHFDHIGAVKELKDAFPKADIVIHSADADGLYDPKINLSVLARVTVKPSKADILCEDNMKLEAFGRELLFIHTPGHTKGGICLKDGKILFTGDSLFKHDIGRCDLPGGDYNTLISSLKNKILRLEDDVKVYPGHGAPSSIGDERIYNEYLR